jgi:hypothetical protein
MYSELAWRQDGMQWQVLVDTAEFLDFIAQIGGFQSHLTDLLEIKSNKDNHALNV